MTELARQDTIGTTATGLAMQIEGLSKAFGPVKALDKVSFDVARGSICGLLGPNGAGKTTLFSIVASFLNRDAGTIRVLDTDVDHISELQGRLSILPQDALFQQNVPIMDQLVFFRMLDGSEREAAEAEVKATLVKVGLGEYLTRGVRALSHGMLKRMGVAQAFLGEPEVVLLDEPTSGLDPQNAKHIRMLIKEMVANRRATVMISSHNLKEIQELCDHVAILDRGRLVAHGSVEEITRSGRFVRMTFSRELTADQQDQVTQMAEVKSVEPERGASYQFGLDLTTTGVDLDNALGRLLRRLLDMGLVPKALSEGGSLEEFFLKVTGGPDAADKEPAGPDAADKEPAGPDQAT